jgi:F-box domain
MDKTHEPKAYPNDRPGDQWTVHHDRADSTLEARIAKLGLGSTESAAPSAPSVPPIFSLSNELLIEIITNLYPNDIYTCRQTCRKLNDLIVNSELIQYILRTALSGMFDPLYHGLSLPERLEALERWETAWAEMDLREPNRPIETPIPTGPDHPGECLFGQYFTVFREGYAKPAGYSFLDVHSTFSSHADTALWTTVEVDIPNVLVFAFAEALDLIVAILCVSQLLAHPHYTPSASRLICDLLNPCRLGHPTFRTTRKL